MSVDISDHLPIFCFLPCSKKFKRSTFSYRLIDETTIALFRSLISEISWESELLEIDPNKAYNSFFDKMIAGYDNAFPQHSVTKLSKKLGNHGLMLRLSRKLKKISNVPHIH
uniref:Putative tick transposon n=1 Tax=Rhipicephalus microplus TaxID=6941 RepID=A0A6G5AJ13_RHIMP